MTPYGRAEITKGSATSPRSAEVEQSLHDLQAIPPTEWRSFAINISSKIDEIETQLQSLGMSE